MLSVTVTYILRSNEVILDFPFLDDNLLIVKGLDIEHSSVLETLFGINYWWLWLTFWSLKLSWI